MHGAAPRMTNALRPALNLDPRNGIFVRIEVALASQSQKCFFVLAGRPGRTDAIEFEI